jgi:ferrous-iron efflux pump FieF
MEIHASAEIRARMLRQATTASVVVAIALALVKFVAVWLSGSVALLASALDSALDASASLVNAAAVRYALKPADAEHRFGHGKSEALAGLAQACLITGSGTFVILRASERLAHPQPIAATGVSFVILVIALFATLGLVLYQRRAIRLTGSHAIKADALHYASDLASNLAALLAVVAAHLGFLQADAWFAIAIALATFYGALAIGWEVFQILMDRELPIETQERIRVIVLSHDEVKGLHALRTRRSGSTMLIQFHLELDPELSVLKSNRIVHEVSRALEQALPGADVLIHQDPAGEAPAERL